MGAGALAARLRMKVALIKTGALGDIVRTTSLVPALHRRFADLELTWVASRAGLPLISHDAAILRAVPIEDPPESPWRSTRYDWVIGLDDDLPSCELASALVTERRSGAFVCDGGRRAYSDDVQEWFGMGILRPDSLGGLDAANALKRANDLTYGELLYQGLGLPLPVDRPSITIPRAAQRAAAEWLSGHGVADDAIIGLNTGASGRWRHKQWGVGQTVTLAQRLAAVGWTVLLLGGQAEAHRNASISGQAAHPRVLNGPTDFDLLAFAAIVARCDTVVCSDSLALHLAVAAGRPVVAFFGPTSDAEIDLFGRGEKLVAPVPCRRCYLSTCDVRPTCMDVLTPDLVLASVSARRDFAGTSLANVMRI
jgi:ADP-heptose:LPS heptosyltransferase